MLFNALKNSMHLLTTSKQIIGDGEQQVEQVASQAADSVAQNASAGLFGNSTTLMMILVYAGIIGAMWFFMVRPQKKREKEIKEMQESIKSGDNIVTSSGFYGKVLSVNEDCFIIEFGTNKGVRIPVRKMDIMGVKNPPIGPTSSE